MLKALLLFVGFVALVYVTLVRNRAWHIDHYEPAARRVHFTVCLGLAVVLASATSYLLRDEILCARGERYRELVRTETQTGKGGLGIECRTEDDTPTRGSVFSGVIAWLGVAVLGFAGASAIGRRFGPPAPPPPAPEAPRLDPPTDKRDRRRQRNRDRRDQARRHTRDG